MRRRIRLPLLMTDVTTGTLREDVLNEKVMSAIVEIKVEVERTEEIIRLVHKSKRSRYRGIPGRWDTLR